MLNTSSSTLNRNRHDIKMNSPYIHPVPLKHRSNESKVETDKSKKLEQSTHVQSTNPVKNKIGRPKTKNQIESINNEIGGTLAINKLKKDSETRFTPNELTIDDDYINKLIS